MELRHLRYFAAVAEELHFGRAAERLRLAQPPLSRQILDLEAELGFPLFDRTRRQVRLTAAGAVLAAQAGRVFEAVDLAVREAHRASRGESGRVAVAYPSSLVYSGLTELLRAFRTRFPSVEVVLREMSPQQQVDALRGGSIDVGFVRAPLDEPSLESEMVRTEPLVVALPLGHWLAKRRSIPLGLLADEPFVLFSRQRGPGYFDYLMRLCHEAGFTPRIVQEALQLDIASLVAAGFGVSIVPVSMRRIRHSGLVLRPIVGRPTTSLLVAWRQGNPSAVLQGFLEVVRR